MTTTEIPVFMERPVPNSNDPIIVQQVMRLQTIDIDEWLSKRNMSQLDELSEISSKMLEGGLLDTHIRAMVMTDNHYAELQEINK
jgi:hypothetical protein